MSETTTAKPAAGELLHVKDSLGRTLGMRKLDAMAELDLIEAAGGKNADNRQWMVRATLAACVTDIDGTPLPAVSDRNSIRARVKMVGAEGIAAVIEALAPEQAGVVADNDAAATAKN